MTFINFVIQNNKSIIDSLFRHLQLVGISLSLGIIISIPLGVVLTRYKKLAKPILAFASIIQTIPGLVMLGFALLIFGIGIKPALVVLTLYAILPILSNTYTGICEVEPHITQAAKAIGMTSMQILLRVELPLAVPGIISGIRISAVYIVSWATLAGLIGAGGLGDLIWTGLATYNIYFILCGAVPSAVMAFVISGIIGLIQRLLTPKVLKGV